MVSNKRNRKSLRTYNDLIEFLIEEVAAEERRDKSYNDLIEGWSPSPRSRLRNNFNWEFIVLALSFAVQMSSSAVAQASNGSISYAIASLVFALITVVIHIGDYYLLKATDGVEVRPFLRFYPVIVILDPKGKRMDKCGSLLRFLNLLFALAHVGSGSLDLIARLVKGYNGFHTVPLGMVLCEVIIQFVSGLGYGTIYRVSCKVRGDITLMCKHEGSTTIIPCHTCILGVCTLLPTSPLSPPPPSPSASSPTQLPHSASSPLTPPLHSSEIWLAEVSECVCHYGSEIS